MTRQVERSRESRARITEPQSGLRSGYSCNTSQAKPIGRYNLLRCSVLAACFCALGVPTAQGWQMHPVQQRPTESPETLDTLAAKLLAVIADSKESSVIVFDFAGPEEISSASEKNLADDFSSALTRNTQGVVVLERTRIPESVQKKNLTAVDLENPHNALKVAKEMKAETYVWGAITVGRDSFDLLVEAFGVQSGKKISGFQVKLPLTDSMREATSHRIGKDHESGVPQAGTVGNTFPACVYCPPVKYTQPAVWHRFEGTVTLSVVITADGRADDVVVVRALPYGLTDKAIETVRSWRFKPAQGSDGNPRAVVQTIETVFRLN